MILKTLLNIVSFILTGIINVVLNIFPNNDITSHAVDALELVLQWTTQALNFVYFIFGDTIYIVLPIATTILLLKYTVLPIIIIIRSVFIKSNE